MIIISYILTLKDDNKSDPNSKSTKDFTYNEMGIMQKIPNGPLSDEALEKAYQEQAEKNSGVNIKKQTAVIMIPETLRNKKLGKNRISSEDITLIFPNDEIYANYTEKSEGNKAAVENARNKVNEMIIRAAEENYRDNPFVQIMSNEEKMQNQGLMDLPKNYKKDMMELAIEREQHIYNKMVKNELDEVQVKKYNRGVINHLLMDNTEKMKQ
jgi:hypothetical protein